MDTQPSQPVYLLFTPPVLNFEATTALINQVQTLIGEGTTNIRLLISSPGGNIYSGMMAYNFLKGCPAEIVTHNINTCDSIAGVIYCAGDRRLSVPHGRFLLHGPRAGFQANTNLTENELEERMNALKNDMDNIAGVLAAATGKEETAVHQDMRRGLTLNPEGAVEYGLVHEISEQLYPAGARVIRVESSTGQTSPPG